jgi:hypothetical protein
MARAQRKTAAVGRYRVLAGTGNRRTLERLADGARGQELFQGRHGPADTGIGLHATARVMEAGFIEFHGVHARP